MRLETVGVVDPKIIIWQSRNHGVLTAVANDIGCSVQFCHLVLRGRRRSKDGRVERLLREKGAPLIGAAGSQKP